VLCVMMMYVRWSDELVVMCNMVMMSVRCVEVICDVCVGDGEVWMCVDMERGV